MAAAEPAGAPAMDPVAMERAADFAGELFRFRLQQLESMRNRSLVSLGLLSATSALLAVDRVLERVGPALWLPMAFVAIALAISMPPLMSTPMVYPIKLKNLREHTKRYTACQIDEVLVRDTGTALDDLERLAKSMATCTDWALRFAVVGLASILAPMAVPLSGLLASVSGAILGVGLVGLAELLRRAVHLASGATKSGGQR